MRPSAINFQFPRYNFQINHNIQIQNFRGYIEVFNYGGPTSIIFQSCNKSYPQHQTLDNLYGLTIIESNRRPGPNSLRGQTPIWRTVFLFLRETRHKILRTTPSIFLYLRVKKLSLFCKSGKPVKNFTLFMRILCGNWMIS